MLTSVLVAYVPVLHAGYRRFFEKCSASGIQSLYILDSCYIREVEQLRKEVRQLEPVDAISAVDAWGIFPEVGLADAPRVESLRSLQVHVVMPDDEVSRAFAKKYLLGNYVTFDGSIFLRWDRAKVLAENPVTPDRVVSRDEFDRHIIARCLQEAEHATDLGRHVGAAIVRDGEVVLAGCNTQMPHAWTPYMEGDARSFFKQGLHVELTTDEHAEARLIGEAARRGIPLEGTHHLPLPTVREACSTSGILTHLLRRGLCSARR
ncbi:MAG: hypothetical protein HYT40_04120 [Candidatus Sungbacteria bacterium]|uniref:CMP/dCMP-type deaminase domain-containing protein n=1 Tax=Candidatus Sungiibacteriota bacterium TaxID=2750080 RepID=A0A931SCB3_9BACT|nr:hypothetical protein [Candidatus Sungbacteria bacterium]